MARRCPRVQAKLGLAARLTTRQARSCSAHCRAARIAYGRVVSSRWRHANAPLAAWPGSMIVLCSLLILARAVTDTKQTSPQRTTRIAGWRATRQGLFFQRGAKLEHLTEYEPHEPRLDRHPTWRST